MSLYYALNRPSDIAYHLVQTATHIDIPHMQSPKRIGCGKVFFIGRGVQSRDDDDSQADARLTVNESDKYYFPSRFHHGPTERIEEKLSEKPDSVWYDNFGAGEKKDKRDVGKRRSVEHRPAQRKEQPKGKQHSRKQRRRGGQKSERSKGQLFMDVQVEILQCLLPPVGFLCKLEKQRRRKAGMK